MFEYKINKLNKIQLEILEDLEIFPIEENFKDFTGYLIYSNSQIESILDNLNIEYEKKSVKETNWENEWKEFLKPDLLADDIYFVFDDKNYSYNKTIKILPALAFGTGTHPTTKIAANLLTKVSKHKKIIDVGCGSAILSIAAEISGAKKIVAMDNDSTAIFNAKTNIEWNNTKNILLFAGELSSVSNKYKADIICANIITSVLLSIKNEIYEKSPTHIILSGIMESEYDKFIQEFLNDDYYISIKKDLDGWCGVLLTKK